MWNYVIRAETAEKNPPVYIYFATITTHFIWIKLILVAAFSRLPQMDSHTIRMAATEYAFIHFQCKFPHLHGTDDGSHNHISF